MVRTPAILRTYASGDCGRRKTTAFFEPHRQRNGDDHRRHRRRLAAQYHLGRHRRVNSSRSSYAGVGIRKSTDGGKTWQHLGLAKPIGRVVLHPDNPDVAWVAALVPSIPQRRARHLQDIRRRQNLGKTIYINENTGGIDLIIDPDGQHPLRRHLGAGAPRLELRRVR